MIARELERLLGSAGAAPSKVATITGQLREIGRLPKAGRGPNAPRIDPLQAATVLTAVAGTSRANEASQRILKLEGLTAEGAPHGTSFISALAGLLDKPDLLNGILEVRVARTIGRAVILWRDGTADEFLGGRDHDLEERFRSVGELPRGLLRKVAQLLHAHGRPRRRRSSSRVDK